nr:MAG TPA: hypothetical protein [Caudoviricetes sp.]
MYLSPGFNLNKPSSELGSDSSFTLSIVLMILPFSLPLTF